MDGMLEFIDTSDVSLMHRQEHTKVTDLSWDPTGRYVVSSLSYWTEKVLNYYLSVTNQEMIYRWTQDLLCGPSKASYYIGALVTWRGFVSWCGDQDRLLC